MPEPMLTCKRECDPIGCECESGYILSDGKCIYPDDCEGEKMFNFNDNNYKVNVRAKSDLMRYKISVVCWNDISTVLKNGNMK